MSLDSLSPLRPVSPPRARRVSDAEFAGLRHGVPVLDIVASPADFGRRAATFVEHCDDDLLGQYKRAQFQVDGVIAYFQFYRATYEKDMTVFVDLATCVDKGLPPLTVASRLLQALGLGHVERCWVHTASEQLFWQRVDPFVISKKL